MGLMTFAYLIAGFVLLVIGAEMLVRGAARLAALFGISPLVIGLTVVAFGTSAPETAVSVQAVLTGSGDIGVGNVVGSNIANILLILGLSALVAPLVVDRDLVRLHVPVMIAAGALVYGLAWNQVIGRVEGGLLLAALLAYTSFLVVSSRRDTAAQMDEFAYDPGEQRSRLAWLYDLLLIAAGLVLLVVGSNLLVEGARTLALALGLSELVIGLTVVAVGTSLPELATSVLAVLRGQRDIAVGNVIGSCIFNLLLVLGAASVVAGEGLSVSPNALAFDFPVMMAVFFACLPIFFSGYRINRWEGLLFFGYYCAYLLYLLMFATGLPSLELFRQAMGWFALPLTAVTLAVIFVRSFKHHRQA